jgi:hypothetical protein
MQPIPVRVNRECLSFIRLCRPLPASAHSCYPHCSDGLAHLGSVLRRGLLLAHSRHLRSASSRVQVRIAERRASLLVSFQSSYSTLFDLDPYFVVSFLCGGCQLESEKLCFGGFPSLPHAVIWSGASRFGAWLNRLVGV